MDLKELGFYKMATAQTEAERAEGAAMVALAEAMEEEEEENEEDSKEDDDE